MSPYEALYGRDCRTPLNWSKVGERCLYGNKKVNEAEEKVKQVRTALEVGQERYKAYADEHRRKVEYQIGDCVFEGYTIQRHPTIPRERKTRPRFIGPFQIYAKRGEVAYALALPDSLSGVYNVFHVSQLRRCVTEPTNL